jgi:hypothetical protein
MLRGVTLSSPMSEATCERVAFEFFERLRGGGSSPLWLGSSVTDDGEVNMDLYACKAPSYQHRNIQILTTNALTLTNSDPLNKPFSRSS